MDTIQKPRFYFLVVLLSIFILLRLPSLFEPNWYGDEGVYQVIGMATRAGRTIYLGSWDNKPPLLFFVYSLVNGDQFSARLLSLLFGLLSVVAFYFVSKQLITKSLGVIVSTIVFSCLFALPILEGNIANTENFMLLPIVLSVLTLLHALRTRNNSLLSMSGMLVALAVLFKVVALFDTAAFCLVLFLLPDAWSLRFKRLFFFLFGWSIPIVGVLLYLARQEALSEFVKTALIENVGYVGFHNVFFIPQGLLIVKLVTLIISVGVIFFKRKQLALSAVFILVWLSFSVFNVFFSQRPYTHYLLLLLPSFCLLLGSVFEEKRLRLALSAILAGVSFMAVTNFIIYWNVLGYYANFLLYRFKFESETVYQSFFDPATPTYYQLAAYLKSQTREDDAVFIWGNAPQVYTLLGKLPPGRFSAAYHISDKEERIAETAEVLKTTPPKFIVLLPIPQPYPYPLTEYLWTGHVADAQIYERNR